MPERAMEKNDIRVLVVEDNPADLRLVLEMLRGSFDPPFRIADAGRLEDALEKLAAADFDVVLLDLDLPDSRGVQTVEEIVKSSPALPLIVLTGIDDEDLGLQALHQKATDYLVKGKIDSALLVRSIRYAIERKRSGQEALRAKQEWERTFDSVPDLIAILDDRHRIVRANRAMAQRLGVHPRECIGQYCYQLVHGAAAPPGFCPHVATSADGREHTVEVHEERLGGDFLISTSPLIDTRGRKVGSVHVARDITERKRAEEQLRWDAEVNSALALLYGPLTSTHTTIHESAYKILAQACRLTRSRSGYVAEIDPVTGDNVVHTLTDMMEEECNVQGENRRFTFPRGSDGRYSGLWGHALNTQEAFYTNSPRTHPASRGTPEGHIPVERFLSIPVRLGETLVGQIALANATRDYTDRDIEAVARVAEFYALAIQRKRAEQELQESQRDLNRAQAVAHTGSWRMDVRRNELIWSEENHRIFGVPKGTPMTYETFLGIVHPEDRSQVDQKWIAALRGEPYDIEHRIVVDGKVRWVRERAELGV